MDSIYPTFWVATSTKSYHERKYLVEETLISFYYSFVYPDLIYCNHVWGFVCKTQIDTLILLQKRIQRVIAGVNRRSHTEPIVKKLKLLTCHLIHSVIDHCSIIKWNETRPRSR